MRVIQHSFEEIILNRQKLLRQDNIFGEIWITEELYLVAFYLFCYTDLKMDAKTKSKLK